MEKLQSENLEKMFCRLCINSVDNDSCQVIGEALKDVLEIVLPKLNLDERNKHFICEACSIQLFDAFNFKSTCIETEDIIFPYIDASKVSVVDLKEVYLREKGNIQLIHISEKRICRLCFQLVTSGFASLNEVDIDIIGTYIPQVNINATRDPVICGPCFDSLRTHGGFVKNCLDAQEQYKSSDKQFYVKTEEIKVKLEEDSHDVPEKFKNIDEQYDIISEKIEIKLEGEVCDGDSSSYDNKTIKNKKMYTSEDPVEIKGERVLKSETGFIENCNDQIPRSEQSKFKKSGRSLDMQVLSQCDKCKFKTKHKPNVEVHQIKKTLSEAGKSKCDTCGFETKHKSSLKTYQLTHKDSSKIRMYKCDTCTYESKYKGHLNVHLLMHKDPSEIQMYKCDTCSYETKYNSHLKSHQKRHRMHKDSLEIQRWKCNMCSLVTRHKNYLKTHQLVHKDPSEIQMYKCDTCSFETKYKSCLKSHLKRHRIHKDSLKIQWWKCNMCSFLTRYKNYLRAHQLVHKGCTEVQMYKCGYCAYESRYNVNLNKHRLTHKDPSEIQIYKCDI